MAAFFFSLHLASLLWLISFCTVFANLSPRQSCGQGYRLCSPAGASTRDVPEIGPGLARLYLNLIQTVNPQPAPAHLIKRSEITTENSAANNLDPASLICFSSGKKDAALTAYCTDEGYECLDLAGGSFLDTMYHTGDDIPNCDKNCQCPQPFPQKVRQSAHVEGSDREDVDIHQERATPGNLCCEETTSCLLVLSYNVPVCWDKFTTDYFLQDGSYGSITSGNYTTPTGDQANLITGNYRMANGQTGNIYQGDRLDEPNTSSMPIPTPWTSSGVGSAIPASAVGSQASSNSSGMPFSPTPLTAPSSSTNIPGTSLNISVSTHPTASASSITEFTSNMTSFHRSTASAALTNTTASVTTSGQPEITPPHMDSATTCACHGLWLMTMSFATVTFLIM